MGYTGDQLETGTPTVDTFYGDNPQFNAAKGCDNNITTRWTSKTTAFPHWWKYDWGSGSTRIIRKLRIKGATDAGGKFVKDFTLQGSNNDSDWTTIHTGQQAENENWQDYTFANSTAYRYYMINITSNWRVADDLTGFWETEMMEKITQHPVFME